MPGKKYKHMMQVASFAALTILLLYMTSTPVHAAETDRFGTAQQPDF